MVAHIALVGMKRMSWHIVLELRKARRVLGVFFAIVDNFLFIANPALWWFVWRIVFHPDIISQDRAGLEKISGMWYNIVMAILKYFLNLYRDRKQITLLSWVYAAVAVIFVFIAGIFALVNQSFGVSMLIVPAIAVVALIANIVIWALIKLVLDVASEKAGIKDEKKKR